MISEKSDLTSGSDNGIISTAPAMRKTPLLCQVTDPEDKRRIVGDTFMRVANEVNVLGHFEFGPPPENHDGQSHTTICCYSCCIANFQVIEDLNLNPEEVMLGQGTLRPDLIESASLVPEVCRVAELWRLILDVFGSGRLRFSKLRSLSRSNVRTFKDSLVHFNALFQVASECGDVTTSLESQLNLLVLLSRRKLADLDGAHHLTVIGIVHVTTN